MRRRAKIRVLIADDHAMVRMGLASLLGTEPDIEVVGEAEDGADAVKKAVYARQTAEAKKCGLSNCPLCAIGPAANRAKIWALADMDADHVAAWSKGGATDISNCQMLCRTHNRAKGNR